ncbi:hypothetical protein H5399_08140 [Tessaracoccus sp. MC1627]|uniref:Ig-like domain-containing protein n=1 Tax=Tessaracoccus sp. MC1627 TaxID=2760312 RepID=UPI001603041E|nr:hypothetical protein [Tessaracoccus sp. MC1627]
MLGSGDNGYEADNLASTLEGLGLEALRVRENLTDVWGFGVPHAEMLADLMEFQSIWYVEAYEGLTNGEVDLMVEYANAGGNLYLTGERPCCEALNASVTTLLRRVLNEQVTVGGMGDVTGPFAFNGGALSEVASKPNLLTDFVPQSPGGMVTASISGVSGRNVLASSASIVVGGVWDELDMQSGKGRVALLMDIDWLGAESRKPIIENLANFLSGNGLCSDEPDRGLSWTGGPENCSLLTPGTYTWSATVDSGGGPYFEHVASDGVSASCTYTLRPPNATYVCEVSISFAAVTTMPTLRVRAVSIDPGRQLVRTHGLRVKNDPRNVPTPFALDSNWWDWPDGDMDGLPDKWETDGVWVKSKHLDLPGLGADPNKKDLFVRYDYESGHQPTQETLDYMRQMFAAAPALEGDESSGINLHIELGSEVPASIIDSGYYSLEGAAIQRVGTYTGYLNSPGYGGGGVPVIFKSLMNLAQPSHLENTIGQAYVKGVFGWTGWGLNWFSAMIRNYSLDGWDAANFSKAASFAQASNGAHELGHLLGLQHHNRTAEPEKCASYKSIMSYSYSQFGFRRDGRRIIDYSRDGGATGCLDDDAPMLDWKIGQQVGSLTFVAGQHGEMSMNFYNEQPDQKLATFGEKSVEFDVTEIMRMTDPESLVQWFDDFGAPAAPQYPTISDGTATVRAGESVELQLDGADPYGASVSYVILSTPTLGTAEVTPTGLKYSANAGVSGTESLQVSVQAGLLRSYPATISILITPEIAAPVISPHVSGTLGDNEWFTDDVTVSWTVEPTSATTVGCESQAITSDTDDDGVTLTCSASNAGGTTKSLVTIKRDATAPVLAPTVSPNPVVWGGVVSSTPNSEDPMPGSGIYETGSTCEPGSAADLGTFTLTCHARDLAGNTATETAEYQVAAPLEAYGPPLSKSTWSKSGSTIPVKFTLRDVDGLLLPSISQELAERGQVRVVLTEEADAKGVILAMAPCRWDATALQYVCVLKTPKLARTANPYHITVQQSGMGSPDWITAQSASEAVDAPVNPIQIWFK